MAPDSEELEVFTLLPVGDCAQEPRHLGSLHHNDEVDDLSPERLAEGLVLVEGVDRLPE